MIRHGLISCRKDKDKAEAVSKEEEGQSMLYLMHGRGSHPLVCHHAAYSGQEEAEESDDRPGMLKTVEIACPCSKQRHHKAAFSAGRVLPRRSSRQKPQPSAASRVSRVSLENEEGQFIRSRAVCRCCIRKASEERSPSPRARRLVSSSQQCKR